MTHAVGSAGRAAGVVGAVGIVLWTAGLFALAVTLFRRDQGRRFR